MGIHFDVWGAFAPHTVLDEVSSYRENSDIASVPGPLVIVWRCRRCGKRMEVPEQQDFSYCMHCGAKVCKKLKISA